MAARRNRCRKAYPYAGRTAQAIVLLRLSLRGPNIFPGQHDGTRCSKLSQAPQQLHPADTDYKHLFCTSEGSCIHQIEAVQAATESLCFQPPSKTVKTKPVHRRITRIVRYFRPGRKGKLLDLFL